MRHMTDTNATIDGSSIKGDLNNLLDEIKKTVAKSGCTLNKIVFTGHGVDDVDLVPGGKYAHDRGVTMVDITAKKPRKTPLDAEDSLWSKNGILTAATQYFFEEIAKLGSKTEGVESLFYACNVGTGKDGEAFLQAVADILKAPAKGYVGEVNILAMVTTKTAIVKYPSVPASAPSTAPATSTTSRP
jgi:hypothetical protein